MSSVLVVDDSDVTHALVKRVLERAGIHTVHASSSAKALQRMTEQRFDAIVVDIVMPDIDGFQLVQLARTADERKRDLPVIFYSAYLDSHNIERSRRIESAYLVPKDGDITQLVDTVRDATSRQRPMPELQATDEIVLRFGNDMTAVRIPTADAATYELRHHDQVLARATTLAELLQHLGDDPSSRTDPPQPSP